MNPRFPDFGFVALRLAGPRGNRLSRLTAIVAVLCLAAVVSIAAAQTPQPGDPAYVRQECARAGGSGVRQCVEQATIATAATQKYHNVAIGLAAGFVKASNCEFTSAGAMGEHWIHLDRMVDKKLDPRQPEILLYLPVLGGRRLVGAEWETSALVDGLPYYGRSAPDPKRTSPAPVMFGRVFDGPMAGHNPVQPWHYDLHVWLWARNPSGLLTQYNPDLSCAPSD